ncbi:MAG: hypothetical protein AAFY44_17135 [Pseudomonadota bacterium]
MIRFAMYFVLASLSSVGLAYDCDDSPLIQTKKRDGTTIGLFVAQAQFDAAPKWEPTDGEPPLSISAAHELVLAWAAESYGRYDDVSVREISLTSTFCFETRHWFYRFDLVPEIDGNKLMGSGNWAAVLMDGTVIGPRRIEE